MVEAAAVDVTATTTTAKVAEAAADTTAAPAKADAAEVAVVVEVAAANAVDPTANKMTAWIAAPNSSRTKTASSSR